MRSNRKFKRVICLALCLCMTLGAVTVLSSCHKQETEQPQATEVEKVSVVRAIKTIEIGAKLKRTDFEEVMIDKEQVPEGAYSSISDIVNKFALVNLYSGDMVFPDKISKVAATGQWGEELHEDYVVITEYIKPGETDMASCIQRAIDENPNKTIYFPDGSYIVSRPLKTSADPDRAVSFRLSTYAHISISTAKWEGGEDSAIFELGVNDSAESGSCSLIGGIIDGSSVAAAISVVGGTAYVNNFSIKGATVGIIIREGAYADIDSGVVVGKGTDKGNGATGVLIEGNNSTLTNMRLSSIDVGVKITGKNNVLRNIHPLYVGTVHDNSIGFWDVGTNNFYDLCYSDQFAVAYRISGETSSVFNGCFAFWYTGDSRQYGFLVDGKFNSVIRDTQVDLRYGSDVTDNPEKRADVDATYISIAQKGGTGAIILPKNNKPLNDDHVEDYQIYLKTDFIK